MPPADVVTALTHLSVMAAGNGQRDTGVNPYGIGALVVGLIILVILLITFRRR